MWLAGSKLTILVVAVLGVTGIAYYVGTLQKQKLQLEIQRQELDTQERTKKAVEESPKDVEGAIDYLEGRQ